MGTICGGSLGGRPLPRMARPPCPPPAPGPRRARGHRRHYEGGEQAGVCVDISHWKLRRALPPPCPLRWPWVSLRVPTRLCGQGGLGETLERGAGQGKYTNTHGQRDTESSVRSSPSGRSQRAALGGRRCRGEGPDIWLAHSGRGHVPQKTSLILDLGPTRPPFGAPSGWLLGACVARKILRSKAKVYGPGAGGHFSSCAQARRPLEGLTPWTRVESSYH